MGDVRRAVLVTAMLALTTMVAGAGAAAAAQPAAVPTVESTSERVLQSVDVSMGPDGTTTGVGSSVVRTAGSVEDAETADETYAPQDVVGDLPVRVLTSWRTSEGAGTDLADLQGYTGRVAIDVTVQNLTVKPQMLTYDAAGTSRQQAALVGSPLTVTASTSLGDLKPERVVTDDKGTGVNITNGILGEGADGTTVQWAALLAPPVLSSSTEMSLVVDAKDFDVPTFDLSVQPGLVTDPSIGALVDSAFNPANSSELDLQRRTIDLITDVNLVLARASDTISDVRTSLTSSADTLGTQTVADLQSSTQTVASNMSSLDGALQSLRGELRSTLESTGSSAIAEMDEAVRAVDKMLGDTSAQPPKIQIRGNGCESVVPAPPKARTLYGSLLQVSSQLRGYADANAQCQGDLEDSILNSIGPEDPEKDCPSVEQGKPQSVTCSLFSAQDTFDDIASELQSLTDEVVQKLQPVIYTDALDAAKDLTNTVNRIKPITSLIETGRIGLVGAMQEAAIALEDDGAVDERLNAVEDALDEIYGDAESSVHELSSMLQQSASAAGTVCKYLEQGKLNETEANEIRGYLVSEPCPDFAEAPKKPAPYSEPLVTRLQGEIDRLTEVMEASDTSAETRVGAALALENARGSAQATAKILRDALGDKVDPEDGRSLQELIAALDTEFGKLEDNRDKLVTAVTGLQDTHEDVKAQISKAVETAIGRSKDEIGGKIDPEIRKVYNAGAQARQDLAEMFVASREGMSQAATTVVQNGRDTLSQQKKEFFDLQSRASSRITDSIEGGLVQINSGVSSSTRDMEAATALLIGDLRKVLLDLGERRVGGGGLLGSMATNAATARTADFQLALAGDKATSYANVRGRDIDGLMLRQAQTDAAMQQLIEMPAFQLDLPSGSQHRTVYSFRIGNS